jgi:hypothetical protein
MRSLPSLPTLLGIVTLPVLTMACSSSPSGTTPGDGGGADAPGSVSFQNDLLPLLMGGCGLSSSCHQEVVQDPKVQRIFLGCNPMSPSCTVPDAGPMSSGPLVYQGLMGLSQEAPSMHYVVPNDPTNSYLLRKLENTLSNVQCVAVTSDPIVANAPSEPQPAQPCGTSMPLGLPMRTDINQLVRAWIMQGAPDN